MIEIKSDNSYLKNELSNLSSISEKGSSININSTSYVSTTKIPSLEPNIITQLLQSSINLFEKLNTEFVNIGNVGDSFISMDNFLADESVSLGFSVTSTQLNVPSISSVATTDLTKLFEKEVPIVAGYNDKINSNNTNIEQSSSGTYNNTSLGQVIGSTVISSVPFAASSLDNQSSSNISIETPEIKTETNTDNFTEEEIKIMEEQEKMRETHLDPMPEMGNDDEYNSSNKIVNKTINVYNGGKSISIKNSTQKIKEEQPLDKSNVECEQPVVNENTNQEVVTSEPIIEPIEEPIAEPIVIEDPEEVKEIVPAEEVNVQSNNSSKKAIGIIAGVGLAAASGIAGYAAVKKANDNNDYDEYEYEEEEE